MDWKQLVIFSENCSRLLNCGLLHKEAVGKAAEVLTGRRLRRFAEGLLECRVEIRSMFASPILGFYGSVVRLGLDTGRLAESLLVGAGYMQELMPVQEVVDRCRWLSVLALVIFAAVSFVYVGFGPALQLLLLLGVLVLPLLLRPLRFVLDLLYSTIPFVGTWSQQLALMEFFFCYVDML